MNKVGNFFFSHPSAINVLGLIVCVIAGLYFTLNPLCLLLCCLLPFIQSQQLMAEPLLDEHDDDDPSIGFNAKI